MAYLRVRPCRSRDNVVLRDSPRVGVSRVAVTFARRPDGRGQEEGGEYFKFFQESG